MRDNDMELANANNHLEDILDERRRLLDIAPKLFKLLFEFCDNYQDETDVFIVDTYWQIVKRVIEALAIEIRDAKQDAENSSIEREFQALKIDATRCLTESGLVSDTWERIEAESSASKKLGI